MAIVAPPDPNELMRRRINPPAGPYVQNMGGLARNTAPLVQRPIAPPAVRTGAPGPAPTGTVPPFRTPQPPAGPYGRVAPTATVAPAVAPAFPQPAAPAPPATAAAPVATPAAPASATGIYGRGGGTAGEPGSLEDQIRGYITNAMGGVTSKAFVDRAKQQLGSATEGQRAQAVNRANEDAIRRGLFRSGIPSEQAAAAGTAAQGAFSSGLANILSQAEQQDIAGRESAAGTAGNLLGMNRQWDEAEQARQEAAAARAAAGAPKTFTYVDPDTGQSYEMDESWFQ